MGRLRSPKRRWSCSPSSAFTRSPTRCGRRSSARPAECAGAATRPIDTPERLDVAGRASWHSRSEFRFDTETTRICAALGGDRRLFVRLERRRGVLHSGARAGGRDTARSEDCAGSAAADAGKPGDREGRAEPEVRHDRAARPACDLARRGVRHDGRQLPARCRRAEPQSRRAGPARI